MRKWRGISGVALGMALLAAATAHAGFEQAGTSAASFLTLGVGARTLGMGGATLGLGEGVNGSAWNPAALGWLRETEAALCHGVLANRSMQDWGAVGGGLGHGGTRWGLAGLYQGDGMIAGRDASGGSTGSFSVSSVALGTTLAQQIGSHVTIGLGAKSVREKLATLTGSGFTFDAGLMVRAGELGVGLAAQNLGGQMTYGPARYPFPRSYGAGLAWTLPEAGVRIAADLNFPSAYHPDVRAGVEWTCKGVLALRAGYRKEVEAGPDQLNGMSFGLGVAAGKSWFDYGYLLTSTGPGQHRLGLRLHLGRGESAGGQMERSKKSAKSKDTPAPATATPSSKP